MLERFLPKDYDYKMYMKHKKDDDLVQQYELDNADNVFNECPHPKHGSLLDLGDNKKKFGYTNVENYLEDLEGLKIVG